jgi:hypothetical protein
METIRGLEKTELHNSTQDLWPKLLCQARERPRPSSEKTECRLNCSRAFMHHSGDSLPGGHRKDLCNDEAIDARRMCSLIATLHSPI